VSRVGKLEGSLEGGDRPQGENQGCGGSRGSVIAGIEEKGVDRRNRDKQALRKDSEKKPTKRDGKKGERSTGPQK